MNNRILKFNLFVYSIICLSLPYIVALSLITPFPSIFFIIFSVQIISVYLGLYSTNLINNSYKILPIINIKKNIFSLIIILIFFCEVIYSRNIPLISPFWGPKVEWNEFGIPFIHTLFNSLCLLFVIRYVSVPIIKNNQNIQNTNGFGFSIFIIILNISTLQRLNFCLIISAILFPFIFKVINKLIFLISTYKIKIKDIGFYIGLIIFIFLLVAFLSQLGDFRNDLTERPQLINLGEFEYTKNALLLPTPLRVLLSYFTSPLLNSYFNKDYLFSLTNPEIIFSMVFPYIGKYLGTVGVVKLEIINSIFNSFNSTTTIFFLKLGPIIVAILYFLYGQFISSQIKNLNVSKYTFIPLSNIILGFSAFSLWFFIEWWNYPSVLLALLLSFFLI